VLPAIPAVDACLDVAVIRPDDLHIPQSPGLSAETSDEMFR
jgi:hypothetical protein